MKFCGKCGSPLGGNSKFCGKCGAGVENINTETKAESNTNDNTSNIYQNLIIEYEKICAIEQGTISFSEHIYKFKEIKKKFQGLHNCKEAIQYIQECDKQIKDLVSQQEEEEASKAFARVALAKKKKKKRITIGIVMVVMFIASIMAYKAYSVYKTCNEKYKRAEKYIEVGSYKTAINVFNEIRGFKDVDKKVAECELRVIKDANVGDVVLFGKDNSKNKERYYREDSNAEWIVLVKEDDRVLIISKNSVDRRVYNNKNESVTWEKCSLRKWLNDDYYNKTFSADEKAMIMKVNNVNKDAIGETTIRTTKTGNCGRVGAASGGTNKKYQTDGGNDTEDRIFLLSVDEYDMYVRILRDNDDYNANYGWLRSPGMDSNYAAYVQHKAGDIVNEENYVNPALWVKIK